MLKVTTVKRFQRAVPRLNMLAADWHLKRADTSRRGARAFYRFSVQTSAPSPGTGGAENATPPSLFDPFQK